MTMHRWKHICIMRSLNGKKLYYWHNKTRIGKVPKKNSFVAFICLSFIALDSNLLHNHQVTFSRAAFYYYSVIMLKWWFYLFSIQFNFQFWTNTREEKTLRESENNAALNWRAKKRNVSWWKPWISAWNLKDQRVKTQKVLSKTWNFSSFRSFRNSTVSSFTPDWETIKSCGECRALVSHQCFT